MDIQEATLESIDQLAAHHRKMFEEIWQAEGREIAPDRMREMEKAYVDKLADQIPSGTCSAWVVKSGGRVVASGAVTLVSFVPVPDDMNHTIAYLHSVYTEKEYRGRKMAARIVEHALQFCRDKGIKRVILNASGAGKMIYENFGFTASPKTMKLILK